MRRTTGHSIAALGLTFGLAFAPAGPAAGQVELVDAGSDQPKVDTNTRLPPPAALPFGASPAAKVEVPMPDDDAGTAIQVHTERVESLRAFALALHASCVRPVAPKSALEKAMARTIAVRKGVEEVEAREQKLEAERAEKPFDARTAVQLDAARREKKTIEDAARKAAAARIDAVSRDVGALGTSLCTELCVGQDAATSPIDLCAFEAPVLANAAVIADPRSVRSLARYVARRFDAFPVKLSAEGTVSLADLAAADPRLTPELPLLAVEDAARRVLGEQHTGLDVVGITTSLAELGGNALANFIANRARREALAWFVERLYVGACGSGSSFAGEVRTFWLPSTCGLAARERDFAQYGAGESMLGALRGAVASDVSSWPGAALGLGLGVSFWTDAGGGKSLFACDGRPGQPPACDATLRLRAAASKLTTGILSGENASLGLYQFGAVLDTLNAARAAAGAPRRFQSERLAIAACAASLPHVFQEYGELVRFTRPGRAEETEALVLASLASAPACASLVGRGFERSACPAFSVDRSIASPLACYQKNPAVTGDLDAAPVDALAASGEIEKLTTVLRWSRHVGPLARELDTRWSAVVSASEAYRAATKAVVRASPGATLPSLPPLSLGGGADGQKAGDVARALDEYTRNSARLAWKTNSLALRGASLVLARASLELALSFVAGLERLPGGAPFPGLCAGGACAIGVVGKRAEEARAELSRISAGIDMVEALLAEDHGLLVARALGVARVELPRACADDECRALCARGQGPCATIDVLARYSGLFSAMARETDPQRVADALEAAATPIGGWRRKNTPGAFSLSLNAYPGMFTGAELRFGTYGESVENGKTAHAVAPVLTMPVGLDFSRGMGGYNLGAFISVIDPAAYLQYDVEQDGRLPGAKLVTLFAPGAYLRAGLFNSPFTLGIHGVFRPGLRAWEAGLSAPGAHALQFGVTASVDVTIFDLFTGAASD